VKVEISEPVPPVSSFYDIKSDDAIENNLRRMGYFTPTPVQKYALPCCLHRRDLMACA
jgi:ATP-dependent RNA helicase DDX3X